MVNKVLHLPKTKLLEIYRKNSENKVMTFDHFCNAFVKVAKEHQMAKV